VGQAGLSIYLRHVCHSFADHVERLTPISFGPQLQSCSCQASATNIEVAKTDSLLCLPSLEPFCRSHFLFTHFLSFSYKPVTMRITSLALLALPLGSQAFVPLQSTASRRVSTGSSTSLSAQKEAKNWFGPAAASIAGWTLAAQLAFANPMAVPKQLGTWTISYVGGDKYLQNASLHYLIP
jgi:hypothetical protein